MKLINLIFLMAGISYSSKPQQMPDDILTAIKNDDAVKLGQFVTKDNVDIWYEDYSTLSQTIRYNAVKCFNYLTEKGANVNMICNAYVPPLMHTAKYGRLAMVKTLIAKGANPNYKYDGSYQPANGKTPITYAEANGQKEIAEYVKSAKP